MGRLEHSVVIRPCEGERHSGDTAVVRPLSESVTLVAIVDVTGHGYEAGATAAQIETFFARCRPSDVGRIMHRLNDTLNGTQGASVGVCLIDAEKGSLTYAGTGNTVFRRLGVEDTSLVSRDGIVGQNMRPPKVQSLTLSDRDLLLMFTDGISARVQVEAHDGTRQQQTSLIANRLVREFSKDHDDAGCIVLRYRAH